MPEPGDTSETAVQAGQAVLDAETLRRIYGHDDEDPTVALDGASLSVRAGELVAILGRSGSGKTTFLNLVSGLDQADEGTVTLFGERLESLGTDDRLALRAARVGFVFQEPALIPELTLAENVAMGARIAGADADEALERAEDALATVDLAGLGDRFPAEVSGGEAQRASVARALAKRPVLLLADEPTANLDHDTARHVAGVLRDYVRENDAAALIVTHDDIMADAADRHYHLRDGQMREDDPR